MISVADAEELAVDLLLEDWELSEDDREWFTVINSRFIESNSWYVVEIGVIGLPDKWVIQVYDYGEFDPCYTFVSPLKGSLETDDLDELPEKIAEAIANERAS